MMARIRCATSSPMNSNVAGTTASIDPAIILDVLALRELTLLARLLELVLGRLFGLFVGHVGRAFLE